MRITFCNNVHCGIIVMSIHAPNVNVMNAKYTFNLTYMFRNLIYANTVRCLFKEKIKYCLQVFQCIYENKYSYADGH